MWTRGPVIGRGSSATVSIATTTISGEIFAVKSTELRHSKSLQREQNFLSKLNSPHIVKYLGFDTTHENGKHLYNLHVEHVPGGTLYDAIHLRSGGRLSEVMIGSYTKQILLGLKYLHEIGLAHCDIKSQNVLLKDGAAKIADLGCAKFVTYATSAFSGKPAFMSPEVSQGSDTWGVGSTEIADLGRAKFSKFSSATSVFSGKPAFLSPEVAIVKEQGYEADICEIGPTMIADRGCAKFTKFSSATSAFSGTPAFMAPEVARGEEQGFEADIWAIGCMVIEMATGENLWPELSDPVSALFKIGFSGECPKIPAWLSEKAKDFLTKCLIKCPRERWNVEQLLEHPFIVDVENEFGSSPCSVLNQTIWDAMENCSSSTPTREGVSLDAPADRRIEGLIGRAVSEPNWRFDEDWITVRDIDQFEEILLVQPSNFDQIVYYEDEIGNLVLVENSIVTNNLSFENENSYNLSYEILNLDYKLIPSYTYVHLIFCLFI